MHYSEKMSGGYLISSDVDFINNDTLIRWDIEILYLRVNDFDVYQNELDGYQRESFLRCFTLRRIVQKSSRISTRKVRFNFHESFSN